MHASHELQGDRDIVVAAVEQDGHSLRWASAELQNDRGVVLAAVKRHGVALLMPPLR